MADSTALFRRWKPGNEMDGDRRETREALAGVIGSVKAWDADETKERFDPFVDRNKGTPRLLKLAEALLIQITEEGSSDCKEHAQGGIQLSIIQYD